MCEVPVRELNQNTAGVLARVIGLAVAPDQPPDPTRHHQLWV